MASSKDTRDNGEARDALFRVKRGLCGYVSYLAACEMNQAFSEYVLYEPILRILTARRFTVHCEYECPGIEQPSRGDKKRLDFYVIGQASRFALEVKWLKSNNLGISRDIEKLQAFRNCEPDALPLLLVFGRKSHLKPLNLKAKNFKEWGTAVYADLRRTKYGCRIFRLEKA
ncbi:MAG TPA: hypothetical protein VHP37_15280 [Burkholderiales bacterium]|nr:hypothetical protein [Burkholderiales bacterium]